jgi:dihydropteroate synthase
MNFKDTFFLKKKTINCHGELIDLSVPRVMGILNFTPDSFYDGGKYNEEKSLHEKTEEIISQGADFIDVGCYSSRPGASDITPEEEKKRMVKALGIVIRISHGVPVSVDTFRPEIARLAVEEFGAAIINDITAGTNGDEMLRTAASLKVPYIMMHMKGNPRTMTGEAVYSDMIKEILFFFSERIMAARECGINDIIVDPGFGFAKNISQNFELLRSLDAFKILGLPLMAGISRKSLIWKTLGITPDEALNGTTVLNTLALVNGTDILRVHDVKAAREAVTLFQAYADKQAD